MTCNIRAVAPAVFCADAEFWQDQPVQQWQARFGLGMLTGIPNLITATGWDPATAINMNLLDSNFRAQGNSSSDGGVFGVTPHMGSKPAKYYLEFVITRVSNQNSFSVGISHRQPIETLGGSNAGAFYAVEGTGYISSGSGIGTGATSVSAAVTGDIIGFVVDMNAGTANIYKNNTLLGTSYFTPTGSFRPSYWCNKPSGLECVIVTQGFAYAPASDALPWAKYEEIPFIWNAGDCEYTNGASPVVSADGLTLTGSVSNAWRGIRSCNPRSSGKFYFEYLHQGSNSQTTIGLANSRALLNDFLGSTTTGTSYHGNGIIYQLGTNMGSVASFASGDNIGVAVNFTLGKCWFSKNGTWLSGDPVAGTGGFNIPTGVLYPSVTYYQTGSANTGVANFGAAFTLLPSGFLAWDGSTQKAFPNTLNPYSRGTATLSGGNLTATGPASSGWNTGLGYVTRNTGKYYFEAKALATGGNMMLGIGNTTAPAGGNLGQNTGGVGLSATGYMYDKATGGYAIAGASYAAGDSIGIAIDFALAKVWFLKNGASISGNPVTGTGGFTLPSGALYPGYSLLNSAEQCVFNFGATYMLLPTGYTAWDGSAQQVAPHAFNPAAATSGASFSNSNRTVVGVSAAQRSVRSIYSRNSGKYYFAVKSSSTANSIGLMNASAPLTDYPGKTANGIIFYQNGLYYTNDVSASYFGGAFLSGEEMGLAVDFGLGKCWLMRNGASVTGDPVTGTGGYALPAALTGGVDVYLAVNPYDSTYNMTGNFGASFTDIPEGFKAWDDTPAGPVYFKGASVRDGGGVIIYPEGVAAGDFCLAAISNQLASTPSGWTYLGSWSTAGANPAYYFYWKVLTSGDLASPGNFGAATYGGLHAIFYRGVTNIALGTTGTTTAPGITKNAASKRVLLGSVFRADTAPSYCQAATSAAEGWNFKAYTKSLYHQALWADRAPASYVNGTDASQLAYSAYVYGGGGQAIFDLY